MNSTDEAIGYSILGGGLALGILAWYCAYVAAVTFYRRSRAKDDSTAALTGFFVGIAALFAWPITIPWWLYNRRSLAAQKPGPPAATPSPAPIGLGLDADGRAGESPTP
ncbi:hypothetical protein [Embleya sp. AB8]|uniref:hypothetical protein n=1 Tax=Embleya sp. AB8 TaxID=3156304 RepID=UPI003C731E26